MTDLYRASAVGTSLINTLNSMIESNSITPEAAAEIVSRFDAVFAEELELTLKNNPHQVSHLLQAYLKNYNGLYTQWRIDVEDNRLIVGDRLVERVDDVRLLVNVTRQQNSSK